MQETGILFNTEMVQANLEYRKGETRRNIKAGFDLSNAVFERCHYYGRKDLGLQAFFSKEGSPDLLGVKSKYGSIGDVLWVKETYAKGNSALLNKADMRYWIYRDGSQLYSNGAYVASIGKPAAKAIKTVRWIGSMYMPKVAARIWLRITDIQVQRLQDITEMEAINEGIRFYKDDVTNIYRYKDYLSDASGYGDPKVDYPTVSSAVESYKTLWCSINGLESWDENPYVWVIKYDIISTTGKPLDFNAKTIPIDDRIPRFGGYMELMKK